MFLGPADRILYLSIANNLYSPTVYVYKSASLLFTSLALLLSVFKSGCPEKFWMPTPWKHSSPGWMGL